MKPTLKSLQDEISFQRAGFDALSHSGVVRIRNGKGIFFFIRVGAHARVRKCVRAWGESKKPTRNPVTRSSSQFSASCVTLFVHTWSAQYTIVVFLRLRAVSEKRGGLELGAWRK